MVNKTFPLVIATMLVQTLSIVTIQAHARELLQTKQMNNRPDFLHILAEDLDYTYLGKDGDEVNIPVLVQLAQQDVSQQEIDKFKDINKAARQNRVEKAAKEDAPGRIGYIKPGWGLDNSEALDRDFTFEAGFRWFF